MKVLPQGGVGLVEVWAPGTAPETD